MRYLRKHISERIRSERGASLMMGLMLFLVVVTVTSVALAAATSVSGRYSQLADMDRSYYNVTSAAKLFWDEMDGSTTSGSTITITRSCEAKQNDDGSFASPHAWSMSFDDFAIDDSPSGGTLTLEATKATLFQILTADALFPPTLSESQESPINSTVTISQVENSIKMDDLSPQDPAFTDKEYTSFKIGPSSGDSKIEDVDVTVKRDTNGTYSFVFEESPSGTTTTLNQGTPFRCTVFARMGIDDSAPRITDLGNNAYRLEWVTTITWQRENLDTGGGTYGTE